MKQTLKHALGVLLGKSGPPVIALFAQGNDEGSRRMAEEMRALTPGHPQVLIGWGPIDRKLFPRMEEIIELDAARPLTGAFEALRRLWPRWVGLAPTLWSPMQPWRQQLAPFVTAPRKVLAFHADGERHHLSLRRPIASWRFARGEKVGDIFRPTLIRSCGELLAWIPVPFLLAGWLFVRLRKVAPPASPKPGAAEGFTVMCLPGDDFLERLDEEVRQTDVPEILATSRPYLPDRDAIGALRAVLRQAGAWMVFSRGESLSFLGEDAPPGQQENGTFCLGAATSVFVFRREAFLRLGGLSPLAKQTPGQALAALCLRGFLHGEKSIYAGQVSFSNGHAPAKIASSARDPGELILAGVDQPAAAARLLHKYGRSAKFWASYWKAVPRLTPPRANGRRGRALLPLIEPGCRVFSGRAPGGRLKVAVVTPYFPFPLAHGGAIRIYNLLRRNADHCDISLFAFSENELAEHLDVMRDLCVRIVLVKPPTWETPRPLRFLPRGVARYRQPQMRACLREMIADCRISAVQIEFTQLAFAGSWLAGEPVKSILVEHDVTFDLYRQSSARETGVKRVAAQREADRWRRYELGQIKQFDRVVTMSVQDRQCLTEHHVPESKLRVIENGVDLERFQPRKPDPGNARLLFIGSFRHFPNLEAYRLLLDRIWPLLVRERPEARLTVVAGPDHRGYWHKHTRTEMPAPPPGVDLHGYVEDVRPLYEDASIVVVPLPISAGTNIKVLEALAMKRPVVSTTPGCAGLGLDPGRSVLVADEPQGFAHAVLRLLENADLRWQLAEAGRRCVEERYNWDALAEKQLALYEELLTPAK